MEPKEGRLSAHGVRELHGALHEWAQRASSTLASGALQRRATPREPRVVGVRDSDSSAGSKSSTRLEMGVLTGEGTDVRQ